MRSIRIKKINFHIKQGEEQLKQELNNYCEETSLKYISARIKKRHNDFTINAVKDAQGRTINKQELIEEEYVKYYSNLYDYKEDDAPSHYEMLENWTVTRDSTWDNLENEFTTQEILEVIKQLNPHKSPGPDGIPNLFYITHKEKLAPILASAFNDTLRNPHLISKNYKEGLIITIPKKGDPELIKNRRPITLANCIYKIHSKLINNRIIPILTKVINHNQKGFVPGRFIIDNIISMNELINYCNDKRINGIITLYDFEKAFDSISHGSILRSLQHINIPTNIINLIMNLLTKSEARIEINGRTTIPFEIKRGVKQGDPLSPTLFVLVIEALARKILQDDRITGLPLNNSDHREKFQSFADDSASMVPDSQQLELVLQHFNSFCKATSSKLNIDKSSSILIGNPDNTNQRIPISTNPERYLGYFFTGKGITRKIPEILNTIRSSLVLWKTTDSTIKTKTNILKAFALSKLTYYSYVENFKEEELNQINKLVEWFLSAPNTKMLVDFKITPKLSPTAKKDQEVNADYANHRFHKEYFEWNYKAIDYDLTRSFAYRNLMALILHNIWIWICNQIYSEDPLTDESLSYSSLLKKWHKLATLEYIKKAKDLKNLSAKDHNNFKDPKILLTSTIKLRKTTANYYCIPESSLPNIISFDQFI
ncbi:hypothetical protein DDB_G0274837 [Dictyostelium discoideum AX4]|uniref:Reverse transcriptase domain-containing protein n=1 Tax=Dictyostelium discoideum TaxID=44689 RepID=Q555Q5_DICDI|nr:hypothetical protein DDB_G0274837 [Dictyostelium discoideum AX4]EAL70311.1 hypothetical protein DDB_G0274837 [Dictyostelium discoideum AX4]|eukprot:XP_644008.1 hypothetical protein DDB_G0274837 [Dictyostelium discoideum AX4]